MGKVYLVGTGPGDTGLLTLKALKIIKRADAVIYDHLINPEVLNLLKPGCERIYAGKKPYVSSIRQNEINKIILDASNKFDITVRLKGGDPFLFGRGGEEAELLKENNIDFEVIPGVSALIAVPEYAGIPVTHRDVSHGIIAATGHNVEKLNIPSLGENKSSYTLVIFMGSKHINEIIDKLLFLGYSENTKIAVIENGTHKDQRVFTGTLKTINYEYSEDPALIVVGDVVSYHEKFGRKNNKFKKMLIFYEFKKINVDYENYGVNIINFRISDIFINNDVKFRFNRNLVISGNYIGYFMKLIKKMHIDIRNFNSIITDEPEELHRAGIFNIIDLNNYNISDDDNIIGFNHKNELNIIKKTLIKIDNYIIDLINSSDYIVFADGTFSYYDIIKKYIKNQIVCAFGISDNINGIMKMNKKEDLIKLLEAEKIE